MKTERDKGHEACSCTAFCECLVPIREGSRPDAIYIRIGGSKRHGRSREGVCGKVGAASGAGENSKLKEIQDGVTCGIKSCEVNRR